MEKHLFELMVERKTRLVVEPSLVEPHVIIAVRDCNLGSKVQLFREDLSFAQVYDWVGSLSTKPEHYCIMGYKGMTIYPENKVYLRIFQIGESEKTIFMSPLGSIAFKDFGTPQS